MTRAWVRDRDRRGIKSWQADGRDAQSYLKTITAPVPACHRTFPNLALSLALALTLAESRNRQPSLPRSLRLLPINLPSPALSP